MRAKTGAQAAETYIESFRYPHIEVLSRCVVNVEASFLACADVSRTRVMLESRTFSHVMLEFSHSFLLARTSGARKLAFSHLRLRWKSQLCDFSRNVRKSRSSLSPLRPANCTRYEQAHCRSWPATAYLAEPASRREQVRQMLRACYKLWGIIIATIQSTWCLEEAQISISSLKKHLSWSVIDDAVQELWAFSVPNCSL